MFSAIVHQEPGFFDFEENSPGRLSARLARDTALVRNVTGQRLGLYIQNSVSIIYALVIAFVNSWQLSLILLGFMPLLMLSGKMQAVAFRGAHKKDSKGFVDATHTATESLNNIRTVTAFNLQPYFRRHMSGSLAMASSSGVKKGMFGGFGLGIGQGLLLCGYSLAFYVGGLLIENGDLTFDEMTKVFFASEWPTPPMFSLPLHPSFCTRCLFACVLVRVVCLFPLWRLPQLPWLP